ncbi:zinc finger and BTB domain-containing protein 40 isoform X1 [Labrus bergylta]|uniref:zinc finger and BTB domain-containing protein 40 isoform X1 n=1 Tax=Labrus bergylta TaxID=56723 RepID=UPI00331346C0
MMELPNYSSQLMQQLWALRKEGHFCDCTILVGDSPHRAHKLVLAASSMLFRSLLDSSDTISIDTAMVSSQEFSCLLDMVYTGKLPIGKHNVSRIVAAADSLQMFDVAVGFKNVLTSLVNQQPTVSSTQTPSLTVINKIKSVSPEGSAAPNAMDDVTPGKAELKAEKECQDEDEDAAEPPCKKTCVELSESSEPEENKSSEKVAEKSNQQEATMSKRAAFSFLDRSSRLVELLAGMSSVLELLSQAAQSSLQDPERQVVCECCEEAEPGSALEKLMSRVKEGQLGEASLIAMLRSVQQKAPPAFPAPLLALLEEAEENCHEEAGEENQSGAESEKQNGTKSEEQEDEDEEDNSKEETEEDEKVSSSPPASSSSPSASKPYTCSWCKKGFAYKCRMLAHVKRCPLSRECEQQCPQCPKKLPNQRALQRHRAEVHRNNARAKKKVACELCGRTFAHPSGMIYHKRTEHFDEKPFACENCGAKFGANSSLKNHMRLHTGEKPFNCKHCDMTFSVAAALAYHTKKKHSEGKMYVCQYCKATFAQSIELTRHVRTHTGDRPYVCRECGKGYSQASGLTVHLHTFHNLSEPHDCQKCCLSFSSLDEHRQHIQDFHPKEYHKCPTCSKVFTSAALLEKHKSTHTGSKPFSCDICSKSYQQLSGLWYHNRTTHPEVFASQTRQLKTLVQCDVCFKFFPSAASVAKHQAAEHQGSEALAVRCPHCPAVLGGEEEMQEHISSQHGGQGIEAFSCPLCSLICSSQLELQEHLLSLHMEATEEQASTSHTVMSADPSGSEEAESVISERQAQLAAAQQMFVALAGGGGGGGGGGEGGSSAEVVEVNMFDLLNSSVTFICEDKPSGPDALQ